MKERKSLAFFRKALEEFFLFTGKFGGELDDKTDVEIAVAIALEMFHTFTGQTNSGFGLGAGADFNLEFPIKSRNGRVTAKNGKSKRDFVINNHIITFTLEDFAGTDIKTDVKV